MGHFLNPIETADVVKRIDTWTQASVKTEDLAVNQSGEGQVVKKIGEIFPDICVSVFTQALIVETVDLGDLARFVVTSENGDAVRISNFERDKKGNCLY